MKELFKRITVNPAVMTGLPCIHGLRIPVSTLAGLPASGATVKEILTEYPDLELDDASAGLFWQHEEEVLPPWPISRKLRPCRF